MTHPTSEAAHDQRPVPSRMLLLLDACTIINLYASRYIARILEAQDLPSAIVDAVHLETAFIFKGGGGDDAREREPIRLGDLIQSKRLRVVTPSEAELDAFIDLTRRFKGDGEAMTIAVALARGWTVVTDDRKAVAVIAGRTEVRSSLGLIKSWADAESVSPEVLRAALADVRDRGNYVPGQRHPLRAWWDIATSTT